MAHSSKHTASQLQIILSCKGTAGRCKSQTVGSAVLHLLEQLLHQEAGYMGSLDNLQQVVQRGQDGPPVRAERIVCTAAEGSGTPLNLRGQRAGCLCHMAWHGALCCAMCSCSSVHGASSHKWSLLVTECPSAFSAEQASTAWSQHSPYPL